MFKGKQPAEAPEISREQFVRTLSAMLERETRIAVIEGVDGIGKTTLLRQFASQAPQLTFALFVTAASRWSYDPSLITHELCCQLARHLGVREPDPADGGQDTTLRRLIQQVARRSSEDRHLRYFILDGLEDVPEEDDASRRQLLGLMPIGPYEQFRFLLSGDLNRLPLSSEARKFAKSFRLAFLKRDEAERFLGGLQLSPSSCPRSSPRHKGFRPT